VTKVLACGEVLAAIQVLEHAFMVGEALGTLYQRALAALVIGDAGRQVSAHSCPDDEPVQAAIVTGSISITEKL
jgi:hypothetical protein